MICYNPRPMKTYKWIMLELLSCAFFFHQADRVLFGLLTIPIQEYLHLADLQIDFSVLGAGYVFGAIAIAVSFFRTFKRDRSFE